MVTATDDHIDEGSKISLPVLLLSTLSLRTPMLWAPELTLSFCCWEQCRFTFWTLARAQAHQPGPTTGSRTVAPYSVSISLTEIKLSSLTCISASIILHLFLMWLQRLSDLLKVSQTHTHESDWFKMSEVYLQVMLQQKALTVTRWQSLLKFTTYPSQCFHVNNDIENLNIWKCLP